MDRLIVGIPDHLHIPLLRLKRLADTVKQREKAGLECGTARREHAAVADADNW